MGIKKGVGILILLILFIIPTIIALDTEITVKTQPSYAVSIRVLNIDGSGTLKDPYPSGAFLDQIADENGEVTITYSSEIVNKVDISFMIKNTVGGNTIQFEGGPVQMFNNNGKHMKAGWPIEIDAIANPPILVKFGNPGGVEETNTTEDVVEETTTGDIDVNVVVEDTEEGLEIEENTEEIDAETKSGIIGKTISGIKDVATSKTIYYIVGALVLVFVIIFIIKKKDVFKGGKGSPFNSKLKKDDGGKDEKSMTERQELEDAERKLEEAKKELEDVRNKDDKEEKIRAIKARFERDKAALEELEKE
tara:strand:- start:2237 stop:3157 length:921 start_codon:yes stop_codon:yes gene_type:complete